jgi:hypothetical protein
MVNYLTYLAWSLLAVAILANQTAQGYSFEQPIPDPSKVMKDTDPFLASSSDVAGFESLPAARSDAAHLTPVWLADLQSLRGEHPVLNNAPEGHC